MSLTVWVCAYQRLERWSRYESWESETAWKMDDSPSAHRWLSPLVCDTASLIDRRLRARDCYLLSCTDVHAQHNLGEWALVDHFAHQVAAHTLSVRKVLEQVTGHFSKAGSCCLLQLPWICHAPIQRWLQHSRHDASDARPLADPQDDAEDGERGRACVREAGLIGSSFAVGVCLSFQEGEYPFFTPLLCFSIVQMLSHNHMLCFWLVHAPLSLSVCVCVCVCVCVWVLVDN